MDYTIEYQDSKPAHVRFKPDFADSNGVHNPTLGTLALREFVPKGWRWVGGGELSRSLDGCSPPSYLIEDAQQEITKMMDVLAEWGKLERIFEEYRGA